MGLCGYHSNHLHVVAQFCCYRESTPPSTEPLQCASLFLDALSDLYTCDHPYTFPLPLIKCAVTKDDGTFLLTQLLQAVQDGYKGEEDQRLLEDFTASITDLCKPLEDVTPDPTGVTTPNFELPAIQSLEHQFVSRPRLI